MAPTTQEAGTSATFTGLTPWAPEFYAELERNNTKEFWAQHKERWEREVRDPVRALLTSLEPEFGPAVIFRPYRDVRFSPDKSPYKTHLGAIVGPEPGVGHYLRLDSTGLTVGGGLRAHSGEQTARLRKAVDDDVTGADLAAIVADLTARGYQLLGAELATRPRGYPADHPRIDLLRRKELMAVKELGVPGWLSTPAALDHVRALWEELRPLARWVVANVGG